ncbi:MAG TPA: DUF72 domain-containing protein, partial [Chromatiales bacterium]|nr:DUF72 domain-containing protein [Chromatiales bacterium]
AWGWRHETWRGGFYPDDLPVEWQLTFYANEFDALGLDAATWLEPSMEELAGWVADTREGFRIYPELPARPVPDLEARLNVLAPRLGATLAGPGAPPDSIERARRFAPVWAREAVEGLPRVGHDLADVLEPGRAPLAVLEPGRVDLRAARRAMEALGPRGATFIMRDGAGALDSLHALRSLRDLMGWQ